MVSESMRQQAQTAHTTQDYVTAERLYRILLKTKAEAEDAINLGALLRSTGRLKEAIAHYKEWLINFPNNLTLKLNGINCALEANSISTAKEWINQGIREYPDNELLQFCDAKLTVGEGRYTDAIKKLDLLTKRAPKNENVWTLISYAYHLNQQPREALSSIENALLEIPESETLIANKISILKELGEWQIAEDFYKKINSKYKNERVQGAYAELKIAEQKPEDAIEILNSLCEIYPENGSHWLNLVASLRGYKKNCSALKIAKTGLSLHPNHRMLKQAMAQCLSEVGKQKQATPLLNETIERYRISDLTNSEIYSLQFIGSGYCTVDESKLANIAHSWEDKILKSGIGHLWGDRILPTIKDNQRIRIGYFSADFCNHPVCRFVLPILKSHNRDKYEIVGLNCGHVTDDMTNKARVLCDEWHEISNLPRIDAARLISDLKIDVLIELGGYTANSRIDILCHKPAKIQLSYLGYFAPTYLKCIDGWIGDKVLFQGLSEEKSGCNHYHVSNGYMAYNAEDLPEIKENNNDRVFTFGCFNHTRKLTKETLNLFCKILEENENSEIALKSISFTDGEEILRLKNEFKIRGLEPRRIKFLPYCNSHAEHLEQYNLIDLALDPMPYGGATTTCEALSMGVPVITISGEGMVGKLSSSLLVHSQLENYVTNSVVDYKVEALKISLLGPLSKSQRESIRKKFVDSPACDTVRLTKELEKVISEAIEIS